MKRLGLQRWHFCARFVLFSAVSVMLQPKGNTWHTRPAVIHSDVVWSDFHVHLSHMIPVHLQGEVEPDANTCFYSCYNVLRKHTHKPRFHEVLVMYSISNDLLHSLSRSYKVKLFIMPILHFSSQHKDQKLYVKVIAVLFRATLITFSLAKHTQDANWSSQFGTPAGLALFFISSAWDTGGLQRSDGQLRITL